MSFQAWAEYEDDQAGPATDRPGGDYRKGDYRKGGRRNPPQGDRRNHLRLVDGGGDAAQARTPTPDLPPSQPLPPSRHLLNWLRHYMNVTSDADLVLWPGIDWGQQPACTLGPATTVYGVTSHGRVTPQTWTRQLVAFWAGVADGSPQLLPGLNEPGEAVAMLAHYRSLVESKKR